MAPCLAAEPNNGAHRCLRPRSLLATYVDRFNARDFDAIRDMLAAEVRLDVVNKVRLNGRRDVGTYFHNYGRTEDWHLVLGLVEGRPAVLVHAPDDPAARPTYFVLVAWDGDRIVTIRDFRYARYVTEDAEISVPV
jgi:RNA polymerase sigma-70 factor (ECF subfamily)